MGETIDTAELRRIVGAIPDEIEMAALNGIGIEFRSIYNGIVLHPKKKYLQAIIDLCMMRTDIADEIDRLRAELAAANERSEKRAAALRYAIEQYGKPGGPWSVPSDPGGWLSRAREALKM